MRRSRNRKQQQNNPFKAASELQKTSPVQPDQYTTEECRQEQPRAGGLPTISICTVTYNRKQHLPLLQRCIANQTYPHNLIEWVIIDDSDDNSPDFKPGTNLDFKVHLIKLETKEPLGKKRNLSHSHCTGQIIVYMDDDDYYPPDRVSHAVNALEGSHKLIAGSTLLPILFLPEQELWIAGPYGENHATANTFAFRRELLEQTQYEDNATMAEEKHFLKDYSIPMVQLNPQKTIICIGHNRNTFEKRKLIADGQNPRMQKATLHASRPVEIALNSYILLHQTTITKQAESKIAKPRSPWTLLELENAYCISLENSHDRKKLIDTRMSDVGLQPIFYPAVTPATLPEIITDVPILNKPTELACLASHLSLIKHISEQPNSKEYALIVEDYVILRENFNAADFTRNLPDDWEIIQLGTSNPDAVQRLLTLYSHHKINFVRWEHSFWGAFGYLIKQKAIRKICQNFLHAPQKISIQPWKRPNRFLADFLPFESSVTYTSCNPLARLDCDQQTSIGHTDPVIRATNRASEMIENNWQNHSWH